MIVLYIKYRTMRFRFDHEGIWKRQGLLWRHETNVAYRRIQDIHLTNGIIQRWLGLATRTVHIDGGDVDREVGLTREGRSGDDACRECSPDLLMSREQDSCSRARRLNHDPSLGPSVVGERRRVFHQFELQNIDEETNRSVIVVNDESDEFQLRHLHVS